MTLAAAANCSLLLEVFEPLSVYESDAETVSWEVATDPDHAFPYLLAPRNYAEQEIDPIRCTASIGTVEVGVIDPPIVPGDQTTGWMTARIHDLLGRRCRLSRYVNDTIGWTIIADGPAGPPKLDASYSAYRWAIRDTRETERKLKAFANGGVAAIAPRGPIYGFGQYTDDTGDHVLLPSVLDTPIVGEYQISAADDLMVGIVNFAGHYSPGVGLDPPTLDSEDLIIDEKGQQAIELTEMRTDMWSARQADILWRVVGQPDWNVARSVSPTVFRQPFVGVTDSVWEDEVVTSLDYATLFVADDIPDGFPLVSGASIEVVIRYRGPASKEYPYYVEGQLGDVLRSLYDGAFSLPPTEGIEGFSYDPGEFDTLDAGFITRINYDTDAFDAMVEQVCLRQTEPVTDTRAWTETALYAPSGWIPALDNNMKISPISRNRPSAIDGALIVDDAVTVPSPNWGTGERTISQIIYTYPRYFVPAEDANIETEEDGLAQREIVVEFEDRDSGIRYGPQIEEFNASAFAAVGGEDGLNIPGQLETANSFAQTARFELLERYRSGAQSIAINVRRSRLPFVRAGDWVPWALQWLPDKTFGVRGSEVAAAQIVSIRDDDCVWRTIVVEEGTTSAGSPGQAILLEKIDDQPGAGEGSLTVLSDEESY